MLVVLTLVYIFGCGNLPGKSPCAELTGTTSAFESRHHTILLSPQTFGILLGPISVNTKDEVPNTLRRGTAVHQLGRSVTLHTTG